MQISAAAAAAADRPPGRRPGPGPWLTVGPEAVTIHTKILTIFTRVIFVLILFSDIISIERAKSAKCTESAENGGKTDLFLMDNRPIISHLFLIEARENPEKRPFFPLFSHRGRGV